MKSKSFFSKYFLFQEKARLEEALLSESGQQQLAIRTFRIQLSKQTERMNTLKANIQQAQDKKEQMRNSAVEVNIKYKRFSFKDSFLLKVKQQYETLKEELDQIELQTQNIDPE